MDSGLKYSGELRLPLTKLLKESISVDQRGEIDVCRTRGMEIFCFDQLELQ